MSIHSTAVEVSIVTVQAASKGIHAIYNDIMYEYNIMYQYNIMYEYIIII